MRSLLRLTTLCGLLALSGAVHLPVAQAADSGKNTHQRLNLTFPMTNPCLGETVNFQGFLDVDSQFKQEDDGSYTLRTFLNSHLSGIGQQTGAKYQGNQQTKQITQFDPSMSPPFDMTATVRTNIEGQGKAPNYKLYLLTHFVLDANGNLTATVDDFKTSCK